MVLSKAKIQNLIMYCALTTYGTYSSFELLAQVKKYSGSSNVTIEDVETIISNMENSDFIYKADSIPAPVYVTIQPEKWQEEAKIFFDNLKREQNGEGDIVVPQPVNVKAPPDTVPSKRWEQKKSDKPKKTGGKVAPTNSTLTVTTSPKQETPPAPEVTESVKQAPPVNKLKQRWYETHKNEL